MKPYTLKACPFCKARATLEDYRTIWHVECVSPLCGALVLGERAPEPDGREPPGYWERIRQTAIDRWNLRAE